MKNKLKNEKRTIIQQCINDQTIPQLLGNMPKGLKVTEITWRVDTQATWTRLERPDYLIKLGVSAARVGTNRVNIDGKFINREPHIILKAIKDICRNYKVNEKDLRIRRIVISDGKNQVSFVRTRKQLRLPSDKRTKLTVLGLYNKNGKVITNVSAKSKYADILNKLEARKVKCMFTQEIKETLLCETSMPLN